MDEALGLPPAAVPETAGKVWQQGELFPEAVVPPAGVPESQRRDNMFAVVIGTLLAIGTMALIIDPTPIQLLGQLLRALLAR
jgi:hypothetical protein